jgi:NADH:ubiquinone oxidoreductase subunit 6 (subunit J)
MSIILLLNNIQFIAIIYLLIYIGALSILFLFVIMIFNLRDLQLYVNIKKISPVVGLITLFMVKIFLVLNINIYSYIDYTSYYNIVPKIKALNLKYNLNFNIFDIYIFSNLLYSYYGYIFLVTTIILLIAMIGSIVLALRTNKKI